MIVSINITIDMTKEYADFLRSIEDRYQRKKLVIDAIYQQVDPISNKILWDVMYGHEKPRYDKDCYKKQI